jgi:hypothetical protein
MSAISAKVASRDAVLESHEPVATRGEPRGDAGIAERGQLDPHRRCARGELALDGLQGLLVERLEAKTGYLAEGR